MKKRLLYLFKHLFIAAVIPMNIGVCSIFAQTDYTQYVNPFIGTGGHGHTFPGATVPFGMVQLSPDTRIDGSWDGCSGYHYSDKKIYGFSHTHLSGTGCSDYGDIMLMPQTIYTKVISPKFYGTTFKHENEKAEAGYYKVKLDNKVDCEFTTTTRAGFHKYTFPNTKSCYLVLDLLHRDKLLEGNFKLIDGKRIEGYRVSEAWAKKQYVYFVMEFSEPIKINTHGANDSTQGVIVFTTKKKTPLLVKVGISQTSIEGARKNLETEIPHWDFEKTRAEAKALWNKELAKIDIFTRDKNQSFIFYTALYHCMIHPSVASDVDGKYRGMDLQIHEAKDFTYYTVFSLWDTFRALHPLFTIIDQKRTNDFIKTFLAMHEHGGRLPVWELSSNETDCMIGYHSVSVIADALSKGIKDFDANYALSAMVSSALNAEYRGIGKYSELGFLGIEHESESVSKTLEYAYDDWCIANFSNKLHEKRNDQSDEMFFNRSLSWRNLFDSKTNFIRPRSNGGWLEPFEPREVNNNYTEANAWQYTFFVPHDVNTMIDLMGGNEKFEAKLDELFSTSAQTTGRTQADITGLIGQYAHGNEPSHHMAYLYAYAGAPQKTQKVLHQIKTEFYKNAPDGLIGNEDCGQMSAWYVFSSLGFYPVCPGDPQYVIGTPSFEKAVIHLENGKDFTINAVNVDEKNFYLNGTTHFTIQHSQIMGGGILAFHMRDTPENFKKDEQYFFPENRVSVSDFIPVPVIKTGGKTFKGMDMYSIHSSDTTLQLEYTFDNPFCNLDTCRHKIMNYESGEFGNPIDNSYTIWARAKNKKTGQVSKWISATGHKIENDWSIEIKSKYNPQYTAGGDHGIIDGLHGDADWRKGGWQGYQAQDFECVIDLKIKEVNSISVSFLQDTRAWIFFPTQVEFYYSDDNVNFTKFAEPVIFEKADDNEEPSIKTAKVNYKILYARFIKVVAKNYGKLPSWHQGYGMDGDNAFIFVDEITIK
jgi:predicted alpha-1,2-mannosidase